MHIQPTQGGPSVLTWRHLLTQLYVHYEPTDTVTLPFGTLLWLPLWTLQKKVGMKH